MTNRDAIFALSIQCSSSTVMVMMLSIIPSIDASMDVISTDRRSAFVRWLVECCLSSGGSKDMCDEFRYYVTQDSSRSRLFPRSFSASRTVIYYASAGVVPKGNRRQINIARLLLICKSTRL